MNLKDYYTRGYSVTPNNATDLSNGKCRAIHVTVAGTISFLDENGDIRTTGVIEAGKIIPISTTRIRATGTSATGIFAWN